MYTPKKPYHYGTGRRKSSVARVHIFEGGEGKITNILLSIVTVKIIATGINMFPEMNTYYSNLIWGGMLVVVLIISTQVGSGAPKRVKKIKKAPQKTA